MDAPNPERAASAAAQEIEALRESIAAVDAENRRLKAAIRWALGEEGEFPPAPGPLVLGNGLVLPRRYWWRSELRLRAFPSSPAKPECRGSPGQGDATHERKDGE